MQGFCAMKLSRLGNGRSVSRYVHRSQRDCGFIKWTFKYYSIIQETYWGMYHTCISINLEDPLRSGLMKNVKEQFFLLRNLIQN